MCPPSEHPQEVLPPCLRLPLRQTGKFSATAPYPQNRPFQKPRRLNYEDHRSPLRPIFPCLEICKRQQEADRGIACRSISIDLNTGISNFLAVCRHISDLEIRSESFPGLSAKTSVDGKLLHKVQMKPETFVTPSKDLLGRNS
jgi:hypothetical protein